ncbi:MAG: hypothetical protein Q8L76_12265 [Cypionkella sp.]|nr:hypothetical protein [Cypionkella sp.]
MNTRNFLYNAALVFGLAATNPSFADEPVNADPSRMTQQEREAYRAEKQAGMTPEQRAEKQESRSQGQGSMARDGSGSGGQYGRNGGGGGGGGGHGRGGR